LKHITLDAPNDRADAIMIVGAPAVRGAVTPMRWRLAHPDSANDVAPSP
jgi:hypothetical protein